MFRDLDSSITQILNDPTMTSPAMTMPLAELLNAEKSFETPESTFTPAQSTVNLFLYETKENRELRDPVPIIERLGTTYIRKSSPIRMDCSYIVTAWSPAIAAARVAEEHRLLAQAILWLSRFPTVPMNFLQGTLLNQPFPVPMYVAQFDPNKNAGEFWDALSIAPRPAFYLTVTIAMDLGMQVDGPVVTTTLTNYQQDGNTGNHRRMDQSWWSSFQFGKQDDCRCMGALGTVGTAWSEPTMKVASCLSKCRGEPITRSVFGRLDSANRCVGLRYHR